MKRFLAQLFGRPGKNTQQNRPRRPCRLAVEQLEARDVPVVGAFAIPPPVVSGTGFDGVVKLVHSGGSCTGTLLATGRHILTAAHCLTDGDGHIDVPSTRVIFQLPNRPVPVEMVVPQASYRIHPDWHGEGFLGRNFGDGNDLAILELPVLAPVEAERREIFRGTNEAGQTFTVVG